MVKAIKENDFVLFKNGTIGRVTEVCWEPDDHLGGQLICKLRKISMKGYTYQTYSTLSNVRLKGKRIGAEQLLSILYGHNLSRIINGDKAWTK